MTDGIKIITVDLSSIARWAWSLFANGRLSEGEAGGKVIERINRAAEGFDRIVICRDWGRSGSSFRRLACPSYKANREAPPEPYYAMLRDVTARLMSDGATCFPTRAEEVSRPEWQLTRDEKTYALYAEADDVICSLAQWFRERCDRDAGDHLRIFSGDTDLWALVDAADGIDVQTLEDKIVGEAQVRERFGVQPEFVVELKALAGDDGDNYKPFPHHEPPKEGEKSKPGIGLKTAAKLLEMWAFDASSVLKAAEKGAEADANFDASKGEPNITGMRDSHERRCLLAGGRKALEMGYACARMLPGLPIDFSPILAEPMVKSIAPPRQAASTQALVRDEPKAPLMLTSGQGFDRLALQPTGLDSLLGLSEMLFNSRLYPHLRTVEAVAAIIFEARERGIPAATALRNGYVVSGRPAWSAAMLAGMVKVSPLCKLFRIKSTTDKIAIVEYERSDEPGGPQEFAFTIEEAERAGWLRRGERGDSKWITNPRTMLRWAALREAARAFFPDVVSGVYTREELTGEVSNEDLKREEELLGEVMKP